MNSRIYLGEVIHARMHPVQHRFRYPVYFYAFDLDELPELARATSWFGYNQLRPVAIHDRDYLLPEPGTIREKLEIVLSRAGFTRSLGNVVLVTAARYFNYIFNPVSFFYCHDADGRLEAVLAQVNNTFGEMHLYLLHPDGTQDQDGRLQFRADKQFHVSPFFPRRGGYEFLLTAPAETIDNTIRYHLDEQLSLVARIHGRGEPLTPQALSRVVLTHPLMASLTMPRILWQAARLYWQRRLPVFDRPVPDSSMTVRSIPPTVLDRIGQTMVCSFLQRLPAGELHLQTPGGRTLSFGRPGSVPKITMTIKEPRFFRRVMTSGDIGFGEAYTDGDWSTDDLPGLLTLLAANEEVMNDRSILTSAVGRLVNFCRHLARPNTVRGSSRNIREHYDLSNAFFETILDPSITYSCALFDDDTETLEQAQRNKLQAIIDKAELTADDHVLEIGCGWGSFALEAVRQTGCRVTGVTVSHEQLELVRERVREAGLEERIEVRLCDYRKIEGTFSKVVSIEMLEAVGHAGLGPFFAACDRALRPGGRAVIQVITIPDRKYNLYRFSSDWIRKHIFPGGHLPSIGAMSKAMAENSTLDIKHLEELGLHYARTLEHWRRTLLVRQDEIKALGFDEAFLRKWEYYFAYCEAGFAAQIIDLAQIILTKGERH